MFCFLLLALCRGEVIDYGRLMVFLEAEEERSLAREKRGLLAQKLLHRYLYHFIAPKRVYTNDSQQKPHSTDSRTSKTRSAGIPSVGCCV